MTTSTSAPIAAKVQDWGAPQAPKPSIAVPLAVIVAAQAALALLAGLLSSLLVGFAVFVVLLVGLALYLGTAGGRWLGQSGARPAGPDDSRAVNLCLGLAADLGLPHPTVWVLDDVGSNAFGVWHRGPNVGVTSGLIENFTRTETEAAIAHRLVHLKEERATPSWLLALGSLGSLTQPPAPGRLDTKTAAVTRYPPALASALEKASVHSGKDSPLWFVGGEEGQRSVGARAEALRDL